MEQTDLSWRVSSYSSNGGATCVEVGTSATGQCVGIRDTTARGRGMLTVSTETFGGLLECVKRGELDLP
jgi:Domain of unknown function (DUF397)